MSLTALHCPISAFAVALPVRVSLSFSITEGLCLLSYSPFRVFTTFQSF